MDKLEVGMYVRLNNGKIEKLEKPMILVENAWEDASM